MSRDRLIGGNKYGSFGIDRGEHYLDQRESFSVNQRTAINKGGQAALGFMYRENNQLSNHRNYVTGLCGQGNKMTRVERKRNLNQSRSNPQMRRDPFSHFFHHHDDFGMLLDSPWPSEPASKPRIRVQDRLDFFSEFDGFFDNSRLSLMNRPRRTAEVIDLIPSVNLFLDNGIRRTGNRRRDQGLLEMFFGQFGDINGLYFDPMHDFLNSRRRRGLDITQILSHLSAMASGSDLQGQPADIDRLQNIKIASSILSDIKACTICQEDFKANEIAKKLSCGHCFHKTCIFPWLQSQNTCPMCRATI